MPVSASCSSRNRFSRLSSVVRATQAAIRRRAGRTTPATSSEACRELQRERAGEHPAARRAARLRRGAAGALGDQVELRQDAALEPRLQHRRRRRRPAPRSGIGRRHGADRSFAAPERRASAPAGAPPAPPAGRAPRRAGSRPPGRAAPSGSAASRSSATTTARAAAASLAAAIASSARAAWPRRAPARSAHGAAEHQPRGRRRAPARPPARTRGPGLLAAGRAGRWSWPGTLSAAPQQSLSRRRDRPTAFCTRIYVKRRQLEARAP